VGSFFEVEYYEDADGVWRPCKKDGGVPNLDLRRPIEPFRSGQPPFELATPFGYEHQSGVAVVVPEDWTPRVEVAGGVGGPGEAPPPGQVLTDLASVPAALGWVAAKTGRNLPAAVLHDFLIIKTDRDGKPKDGDRQNHWYKEPGDLRFEKATRPYQFTKGPSKDQTQDRLRADRMFRDAMRDLGVDPIRAWLMWAAVAAVTVAREFPRRWYGWLYLLRSILVVALCGFVGLYMLPNTILDAVDFDWFLGWEMPFMTEASAGREFWEWALVLLSACAVAAVLFAVPVVRDGSRWLLGVFLVPLYLFGWAAALTVLFAYGFGAFRAVGALFVTRWRTPREAVFTSPPELVEAPAGGGGRYRFAIRPSSLREDQRVRWVKERPGAPVEEIPGAEELVVPAGPAAAAPSESPEQVMAITAADAPGTRYRAQIVDRDDNVVAQSYSIAVEPDAG
jgi:hypothetical protein